MHVHKPRLAIWILLGALWFLTMPVRPLFDPDEGRYAEIPREMFTSGDWVTPTLNNFKYFEKPPLQYWATATLYSIFGVHDWTSRLWAAGLAFLCLPLVFAFATRLGYPTDVAVVGTCLLGANPYFALAGQLNLLDQALTFFLCTAIFSFVLAQRELANPRRSRNWTLLTWACLALAVLAKGIVAPALASLTLLVYVLVTRDVSPLKRLHPVAGLPLFALIVVPWFWLVQGRNPDFAEFFFFHEHIARFLTTVHERVEPWWYFLPILLFALLPVIWNCREWRLSSIEGGPSSRVFRAELLLIIWCCVVVCFFSLSQSKLASYVMPVMPVVALLLARVTRASVNAYGRAKWTTVALMMFLATGLTVGGWQRQGGVSASLLAWAAAVAALCLAFLIYERIRPPRDLAQSWMVLAAISIAGYRLIGMCYGASYPNISAEAIAAQFSGSIPADARLYSVGQYRHSLAFYLRRTPAIYDYVGEFEFGMQHSSLKPAEHDRAHFLRDWQQDTSAVAFIDTREYSALAAAGIPGYVLANDGRSVVLSRQPGLDVHAVAPRNRATKE